ncbi:hypothetical protein JCM8547_005875 [Rhodosporidiobolus lusitaniae]
MGGMGLSTEARGIVREAYEQRDELPAGIPFARSIQERIKQQLGVTYPEDKINHVMRQLPTYEPRKAGYTMTKLPEATKNIMHAGWLRYRTTLEGAALTDAVIAHVQANTNPSFTPTRSNVTGYMRRWRESALKAVLPTTGTHPATGTYNSTPSWPAAPSYSAPSHIYQNHSGHILHPNEVFEDAQGYLVDAEGYPVTVLEV